MRYLIIILFLFNLQSVKGQDIITVSTDPVFIPNDKDIIVTPCGILGEVNKNQLISREFGFIQEDTIRTDTTKKEIKLFFADDSQTKQQQVLEKVEDINCKLDSLLKKLEAKKDTINGGY